MNTAYADSEFEDPLDTQLTLGTGSLLAIFFSLVMICGIFFGFGYTLGRRNFSQTALAANKAPAAPPSPVRAASPSTPAPAAVVPPLQASPLTAPELTAGATRKASDAAPAPRDTASVIAPSSKSSSIPNIGTAPTPLAPIHIPKPSAIHAALVQPTTNIPYLRGVAMPPNPYKPAETPWVWTPPFDVHRPSEHHGTFRPRIAEQAPHVPTVIMIAALSRQDDAEVLASALRKGGFTPSIHNGTEDALYHVQVGPYDRNVAMVARQRLIARGYNAVIK